MKVLKFLPLVFFLIVSIFLYSKIKFQKKLEPLSSALIEKNFPLLKLESIDESGTINEFIENKFVIINIFASWCGPCRIHNSIHKLPIVKM